MKIVVVSHTQEKARDLWNLYLKNKYSGYEKPIFNDCLNRNLDGWKKNELVFIFAGGYVPQDKTNAMAMAYYMQYGAMFINENDSDPNAQQFFKRAKENINKDKKGMK